MAASLNTIEEGALEERRIKMEGEEEECTIDGTVDRHGMPAIRKRSGSWSAAILILVNQVFATLAFYGVQVNIVLFYTRVMGQGNAEAANNVSQWTGTVYVFGLIGAFLSDSYWGRYKTCAIFQAIFVIGLSSLSLSTYIFLQNPKGCGDKHTPCKEHSSMEVVIFNLSIYLIALGYGGYQPNIVTFGADQFDENNAKEGLSKVAFFSYYYLALNLGCLFSKTLIGYFEDRGSWTLGFSISTASGGLTLLSFFIGIPRYRHFRQSVNPLSRFFKVVIAAMRKWTAEMPPNFDILYESDENEYSKSGIRRMPHTQGFKFLDKAAIITSNEYTNNNNSWRLCTVTQVEEAKCILRLIPIWLCTIIYYIVFTQMGSLFVIQGAAMKTKVFNFNVPPASISSFNMISVVVIIFIYRHIIDPLIVRLKRGNSKSGLTELQRMGTGLVIAAISMISAGVVEYFRLQYATTDNNSSSLNVLWQIPQYVIVGASEVFMYIAQLEFFNKQAPDGLKSFASALCMTSVALGNYASALIVTIVMKLSAKSPTMQGWIPENLNKGQLDKFYYLIAGLTALDFVVFVMCAKAYKYVKFEEKDCDDLTV